MEKKLNRSLYIIPAVYLLLTGLFFYLHYSQTIHFSQVIGNIELTGQSTKGTMVQPSEIKKLNIYVNGMSFPFSSSEILEVTTADEIKHKSDLLDFSHKEDSFSLHFENNINLIFKTDFADNKISISAQLPDTVPPITKLSLPFMEDRGFALGYTEEDNTPVITNGETNYFLALTNEYQLSDDENTISISVSDNTPITFMIQETLVGKGRTAEKWYEQNETDIFAEYNTTVDNYVNSAFFGWNSRFNSKTGMWTDGNGVQQFNEITATSYLSESLVRGSYKTAASLIRTASVNMKENLTAMTATYLGNIVEKGKELISSQKTFRQKINAGIIEKDSVILQEENLIDFMLSNNLESKIEEILSMALTATEDESISDTLFRLGTINDGFQYISDENINTIMIDIIEDTILPHISWLDEGLFLVSDDKVNISESFHTGKELISAGFILSNDFYTTVGKEMIISILNRSKESAFLPEFVNIDENRIASETGSLLPEDFYLELTENPFFQKQQDLGSSLGPGSWILTSAQYYDVQNSGKETLISVNFPKGSMHHYAIKGVKPFTQIFMHNLKWNSDPNFQRYSDGWYYDKFNETLYVKMTHRVENERIRILYYNPELPVTQPETP